MVSYTDDELPLRAHNVRSKVVVVTGAASGFGKATAIEFARHGAKLVLGDINGDGARFTSEIISHAGGEAVWARCDVRSWTDQVALFRKGVEQFGRIDIVIANAGIREMHAFTNVVEDADGLPMPPQMDTLEVNLIGVLYTCRLAIHYLTQGPNAHRPGRAVIITGSMSSLIGLPGGCLYTAAKHALVGLMRCLYAEFHGEIRTGIVCPWFSDTGILTDAGRALISDTDMPLAPVERVVGAILCAASSTDAGSDGCIWTVPDGGEVFRIPREAAELTEGVFKVLNQRLATNGRRKGWSQTTKPRSDSLATLVDEAIDHKTAGNAKGLDIIVEIGRP